jgi:hypothetical protein
MLDVPQTCTALQAYIVGTVCTLLHVLNTILDDEACTSIKRSARLNAVKVDDASD